jgi:hypothetical protein
MCPHFVWSYYKSVVHRGVIVAHLLDLLLTETLNGTSADGLVRVVRVRVRVVESRNCRPAYRADDLRSPTVTGTNFKLRVPVAG